MKKIYLVALESNTGTDRLIVDLNERLKKLNYDSCILNPSEIIETWPILNQIRKFIGWRYIGNLIVELYILFLLIKNRKITYIVVTFIYPLWSPLIYFLKMTGRFQYMYQLPDMMWMKKYVSNLRWKLQSIISRGGIINADIILTPTTSAQIDCITFMNKKHHVKIARLTAPINNEYWKNIPSICVPVLKDKKFIFHPAGLKNTKNTKYAVEAFINLGIDDVYFVYIKNSSNTGKNDIDEFGKSIVTLYNLSDQEMKWLYENSLFVSIVSIEEGIGLPILEAKLFGKIAVVSNASALPETAEHNAIFVDPFSTESICDGYKEAMWTIDHGLNVNNRFIIKKYGINQDNEIKSIFG